MKKVVALILVLVLGLSLCACTKVEEAVVGKWECTTGDYYYHSSTDYYVAEIEIYPGGTGERVFWNYSWSRGKADYDSTWEIRDDILNITDEYGEVEGFRYDAKNDTLTSIPEGDVFTRVD